MFEIPRRDEYEKIFHEFMERSGFDTYGNIVHEELKPYATKTGFENDTFVLRPFY